MYVRLLFISMLLPWSLSSQIPVETTIQIMTDQSDLLQETVDALEMRLLYAGYDAQITPVDSAYFRISTRLEAGSLTDSIQYRRQFENNTLDFRIGLWQEDRIIRLLYEELKGVDGLLPHVSPDPSAIYISRDPQLLDEQLEGLMSHIDALKSDRFDHLAFSWSAKPKLIIDEDDGYLAHILYAYDATSDYGLDESHVKKLEIENAVFSEEIHFQLIDRIIESWQALTQKAVNSDARSVLYILNNEVISSKRMVSTIRSGKGVIPSIRNRNRARNIVDRIRLGRLPAEVVIVSSLSEVQ